MLEIIATVLIIGAVTAFAVWRMRGSDTGEARGGGSPERESDPRDVIQ